MQQDRDPRLVVARSFTQDQRTRFVYAVARGKSRTAACREVGVSWAVCRRALEADAVFREEVADAEAEKWMLAEEGLYQALKREEPWAIKEVLKGAVGVKERWTPPAEKVEVEMELGVGAQAVAALQARLEERRLALASGSGDVLDVESEEPPPG